MHFKKPPYVSFVGEPCADMGGPTKEYFHNSITSLTKMDPLFNIQLFGGVQGHMIPICGVDAVRMAGKLVATAYYTMGLVLLVSLQQSLTT